VSRRVRLIGSLLLTAAAIAVLAIFGLASDHSAASGRPAPQLPREQLIGSGTTLSSLLSGAGGRPVAVVFWASWCHPCTEEAAALESFSKTKAGRGRIVGVDWSDRVSGARSFIAHYGWSFPNVRDGEGLVGNEYRMPGLPTTFVVDGHGRIRKQLSGPQDGRTLSAALDAVEHS
jgi:cytochrome c biogenesis protein CcmG, thiol:disulfide interchange protein DsbE